LKVVTIIGARPQFIKAAPVSVALRAAGIDEVLVDTGQHYDDNMAAAFVRELGMQPPVHTLGVGSGPHGAMTGRMMERAEQVLLRERPDAVLVYGDTNSTIAGALAAAKLALPLVHVEAGLRSRKTTMPEEINRRVTDHVSTLLCCPTVSAVENLKQEGLGRSAAMHLRSADELKNIDCASRPIVVNVGDVMVDALQRQRAQLGSNIPVAGLKGGTYALVTIHRAEATDERDTLAAIVAALAELAESMPVVFPLHPRTKAALGRNGLALDARIRAIAPVSHGDFMRLLVNAKAVVTDSGGVQKEACILEIPCFTLRDETEWDETVQAGWNMLLGSKPRRIAESIAGFSRPPGSPASFFGDGNAAGRIAVLLKAVFENAHS
jgi:UDP-GlcNAc3NAcA epimerase